MTKNWEENDYYDSDEDSFLDRTGECQSLSLPSHCNHFHSCTDTLYIEHYLVLIISTAKQTLYTAHPPHLIYLPLSPSVWSAVEQKRRQRMKRLGKLKDQAESYDSLVQQSLDAEDVVKGCVFVLFLR